jgi:hypothetical protein
MPWPLQRFPESPSQVEPRQPAHDLCSRQRRIAHLAVLFGSLAGVKMRAVTEPARF